MKKSSPNEIVTKSQLNVRVVAPTGKKFAASTGFEETFDSIGLSNANDAYLFRSDFPQPPNAGTYNSVYVRLPLPSGFSNKYGKIVNSGEHTVIPLLIYFNVGESSNDAFVHKCSDPRFGDYKGTECAALLQSNDNTVIETNVNNVVYFNTKDVAIPAVRGNEFFNSIITDFNKASKGKKVYYLPTVISNGSVIYVVSRDESKIKKLISQAYSQPLSEYIIGLNGFIMQIDDWSCSILLDDTTVIVNAHIIKSSATVSQ
jgi:hypothetical protein